MDYKEKYEQALERVGELLSRCIDDRDRRTKVYRVEDIESIFPELKEPKDELTWLTKYIEEEAYSLSMDIRDNEDRIKLKKLQKALAWLEKQGEYKSIIDGILTATDYDKMFQNCNVHKFNIGDWIVDKSGLTQQVLDLRGGIYTCTYNSFTTDCESNYYLWTIQDAKDGDILYLQHDGKEHIIIYKGIIKERFRTFVSAYCAYNGIVDAFCFADVSRYADIAYGSIMPATKEQRDLLFVKIKEAGYEWDAEKKELMKIEKSENICLDCINRKGCIMCENGNMKETLEQKPTCSADDRQDDKINEDFRNLHKELVNRIAEWCKEHNVIIDEFSLGADGFAESCKCGEWVSATDSSFSCRKFSEEYKKAFWDMDRSFSKEDYDRIEQESRIPYLYSM